MSGYYKSSEACRADQRREERGCGLNYLNGIGSPQQSVETAETVAAAGTSRTGKDGDDFDDRRGAGSDRVRQRVDEAKLSTTAGVMAQALLGSDLRTDKVAALQQSIAAGTYNVPAPAVADKLMRALLE